MDSGKFKEETLKAYYEWFNRNAAELSKLSINDRINEFLKYEKQCQNQNQTE